MRRGGRNGGCLKAPLAHTLALLLLAARAVSGGSDELLDALANSTGAVFQHIDEAYSFLGCVGQETERCRDLYEQKQAAQTVAAAVGGAVLDQSGWRALVEAAGRMPALDGSDDIDDELEATVLSQGVTVDHLVRWVSEATGEAVGYEYFLDDDYDRRLSATWQGVQVALGRPWPDRLVHWTFHPDLGSWARSVLLSAMKELETKTCVRFQEHAYGSAHLVTLAHIEMTDSEAGCWATIGYRGEARLNLGFGCAFHSIALHELLHTLGQAHEHSRKDRDHFVEVKWENIMTGMEHNYNIYQAAYTAGPYDYASLMHYPRFAFSKNQWTMDPAISWTLGALSSLGFDAASDETVRAKNPKFQNDIGTGYKMTDHDVLQVLHMYQCPKMTVQSANAWTMKPTTSCIGGLTATSCSCYSDRGDCRGAYLAESRVGSDCVAASRTALSPSPTRAYAICHRFASPHYLLRRLSGLGESGTASESCHGDYKLLGCSCISSGDYSCGAAPAGDTCTATASGGVWASANCVHAPAINASQVVVGAAGTESTAVCPDGMELTGCSCGGLNCKGARAYGEGQNACRAKATDSHQATAYAICAHLLESVDLAMPRAEGFTGGDVGDVAGALTPIQSVYCEGRTGWDEVGFGGCSSLTSQYREKALFDCGSRGCNQTDLGLVSAGTPVTLTAWEGQEARCPLGFLAVRLRCVSDCAGVEIQCAAPSRGAPWYLSGNRYASPWFDGETGSGMASCGDGLVVGVECQDTDLDGAVIDTHGHCDQLRLWCRGIAIVTGSDGERHGTFDFTLHSGEWSAWVSSTGAMEWVFDFDLHDDESLFADERMAPLQQMQCEGQSCDNVRLYSVHGFGTFATSVELSGSPSVWTVPFNEGEMECPNGHYAAGLKCMGAYCESKSLLCATPAGDWVPSGSTYYSHCFTHAGEMPWWTWWQSFRSFMRGKEKQCVGTSVEAMPDAQTCGADGIIVGLKCFGGYCDRLQLLCRTLDANVDVQTGNITSAESIIFELGEAGLWEDMSIWAEKPVDGQPVQAYTWDGSQLGRGDSVSVAWSMPARGALIMSIVFAIAWGV